VGDGDAVRQRGADRHDRPGLITPEPQQAGADPTGDAAAQALRRLEHPARARGARIVVIVGAGFAGLNAASRLASEPRVQVLLLDRRNHHLFQPLLYQVAMAGLNPSDIAVPIRAQFPRAANVEVHLAHVTGVDLDRHVVRAGELEIVWDALVLACGAQHSYFGHPGWEDFAPGLKTVEQALEIRRRMLSAFELAENQFDPAAQLAALTFVVVGGGPTGVELAGAIADISRTVLVRDFRRIDPTRARVVLVEAGPRILAAFPEPLARRAHRDLTALGVEVRTAARVDGIDRDGVSIGAERIAACTVLWAAGVQARTLAFHPPVATDRVGRIEVGPDLSLPGHPEVFVLGDMAAVAGADLPGLAQVALQAGRHAAEMIVRDLDHRPRTPFRYRDKGIMATIGKSRAVAVAGPLRLGGTLAWLAWLFVHIYYLVGFRNRLGVMWQWVWSYVFSKRGARLITEPEWRLPPSP
jgi:NADH:quinone reductase (non-electrogenic)